MVFLNKTRERGMKLLNKEKKKLQKLVEKASSDSIVSKEAPQQPQTQPQPQQPVELRLPTQLQTPRASLTPQNPVLPTLSSISVGSNSAPWWISDVTFIVEGKKIPGHKVVLQSRSEYFTKLFQNNSQDVTLEINEFSHHTFTLFVRWIYGGKKDIPLEDVQELLRCAIHFEAGELITLCNKVIAECCAPVEFVPAQEVYQPFQGNHQQHQQHQQLDDQHYQPQESPPPQYEPQEGYYPEQTAQEDAQQMESDYTDDGNYYDSSVYDHNLSSDPMLALGDESFASEENYGAMNMWSSDPTLFHPSSNDDFRIMEIC